MSKAIYIATALRHRDDWQVNKLPQEVVQHQAVSNFDRNYAITSDLTKNVYVYTFYPLILPMQYCIERIFVHSWC